MPTIKLLPEGVWSRIAAGEVVERPVSAVKEMLENSLDAGSKRIRVKLWDGGRVRIAVEDDGCGITFDELPLALTPHATSKIQSVEDLEKILTLGYRGEALGSLAAIAKVEIRSRTADSGTGGVIKAYEGKITGHAETNCTPGTRVQIDEIFANLPARRKFLKSAAGELRRVATLLREYAICRPEVAFALENDGRAVFSTDGGGDRKRAIEQLWGSEPKIRNVETSAGRIKLECWWQPRPSLGGGSGRNEIASFVNGRAVSDPVIKGAVSAAARELAGGWALFFSIEPSLVDVNIHPAKAEIRFRYPGEVFEAVKEAASKLGGELPLSMNIRLEQTPPVSSPDPIYERESAPLREGARRAGGVTQPAFTQRTSYPQTASFQTRSLGKETIQSGGLFTRVEIPDFDFESGAEITAEIAEEVIGESNAFERDRDMDAAYLGQLASGYLVFDAPDGLALVDPHAAHEKVAFERIKSAASEGERSQQLLMPSPVPPTLQLEIEEKQKILEDMGFAFETAEGLTRLTAVPYLANLAEASVSPDALLRGSIAILRNGAADKTGLTELLWRNWAVMACKEAVKVTTKLTREEASTLWDDLHRCAQPFFCPHGRPTILKLSPADLSKHFGRE